MAERKYRKDNQVDLAKKLDPIYFYNAKPGHRQVLTKVERLMNAGIANESDVSKLLSGGVINQDESDVLRLTLGGFSDSHIYQQLNLRGEETVVSRIRSKALNKING